MQHAEIETRQKAREKPNLTRTKQRDSGNLIST